MRKMLGGWTATFTVMAGGVLLALALYTPGRRSAGAVDRRAVDGPQERAASAGIDRAGAETGRGLDRPNGGFRETDQAHPRGELSRVPQRRQAQGRPVAGRVCRRARRWTERRGRPAGPCSRQPAPGAGPGRGGRSDAAQGVAADRRRDRHAQTVGRSGRAAHAVVAAGADALGGAPRPHGADGAGARVAPVERPCGSPRLGLSGEGQGPPTGADCRCRVRAARVSRHLGSAADAGPVAGVSRGSSS